jgi:hypothetical protein
VKLFLASCLLLVLFPVLGQEPEAPPPAKAPSKEALRLQIADLKVKAFEMQTRIELLEKQLQDVEEAERNKPVALAPGKPAAPLRCAGHTKDGARCSRNAEAGGRFCWQHKARR